MSCAKDPQKAKLVHGLEGAALRTSHIIRRQLARCKLALAGPRDCIRGREPTIPVADPVGVTGPDDGGDAGLDNVGELREEGAGVVAGGGELLVRRVGAFLVGGLGADGLDDGCVG